MLTSANADLGIQFQHIGVTEISEGCVFLSESGWYLGKKMSACKSADKGTTYADRER